jgi:DNA mismatch repair protein MutS2
MLETQSNSAAGVALNESLWSQDDLLADALERLEWKKLISYLAELSTLEHTKARLAALTPWISKEERLWSLAATGRILRLLDAGEELTLLNFDASYFIPVLQHGSLLNGLGLYHLGVFCSQIERLLNKARSDVRKGADSKLGPELGELLCRLHPQTSLARRLQLSADESGRLLDSASSELKEARHKFDSLTKRMTQALEGTLKVPTVRDALQDTVWMIRDGRYVLPVRVDRKSDVPGIARGVSSTGNTIFIEPSGLSDLQSQLSGAEADVMVAENRVLRAFSDEAYSLRTELQSALEILEIFDSVTARARLARKLQGVCPRFSESATEQRFEILDARHPLFVLEEKDCIANNLVLAATEQRQRCPAVWVLSGPNAGGKTVAMKSVGLIAAMGMAGLYVPARSANLFTFQSIYVEMGDRQSRSEDLSTFSGHLLHVKTICDLADAHSLILLDEGFVGTDPSIGAALAQATLETLAAQGSTAVITTHFSSLKTLADKQPDVFANASMEFEPEKLKPTFHLLNGVPGQSFAVELARRLNYPEDLLQRALKYRGERELELENLLAELQKNRHSLKVELDRNLQLNSQLAKEVTDLQSQRRALDGAQAQLMNEYTTKMQKRFNAFENRLETRARQFERAQQQILNEKREAQQIEQNTEVQDLPVPALKPVQETTKPLTQSEIQTLAAAERKKARTLNDFSQLAALKRALPSKKSSDESATDETDFRRARHPARLTQRDLMDEARESLESMRQIFEHTSEKFDERRTELSGELRATRDKGNSLIELQREQKGQAAQHPAQYWQPGLRCKTRQFQQPGHVIRTADGKGFVECQFGLLKTKIHFSELLTIEQAAQSKPQAKVKKSQHTRPTNGRNSLDMSLDPVLVTKANTVDVRGHLVDTALEHVERFLDKAWMNDERVVVVVHGHGTGRIKVALREFLQECSYPLRFRPGTTGEGGDGATIIVFEQ